MPLTSSTDQATLSSRSQEGAFGTEAVSVIVPVTERPEHLADLYRTYSEPLNEMGIPFEFVFALDRGYRDLAEQLSEPLARGEPIRILESGQSVGETSLVTWAADHARADILLTLPAYYRVEPDTLPRLLQRLEKEGVDVTVARRWPREDSWINRMQTKIFHFLLRRISQTQLGDVACGVRAIRRSVLEEMPLYGDFFRLLPLLALNQGFRVEEVDGRQHAGDRNPRVYGPGIYLRRLLDLFGAFFLVRFTYKPLRFFGLVGTSVALAGAAILGVLLVQRISGQGIADRPLLLLGVLLVTLGVQGIALGLIGEIIVHLFAPDRQGYRVLEADDEYSC